MLFRSKKGRKEEMKLMKEEEDTAAQRNNMVGLTMGYGE